MDDMVLKLVKLWRTKAKSERDVFSRFVFLYFCFNALIANLSGKEYDGEMIDWICNNDNPVKERFFELFGLKNNLYFPQRIENMKALTPVYSNLRQKPPITITDTKDFENVIRAIYYVRCNLFHGCKNPNDVRDYKLAKVSADILEKLVSVRIRGSS